MPYGVESGHRTAYEHSVIGLRLPAMRVAHMYYCIPEVLYQVIRRFLHKAMRMPVYVHEHVDETVQADLIPSVGIPERDRETRPPYCPYMTSG